MAMAMAASSRIPFDHEFPVAGDDPRPLSDELARKALAHELVARIRPAGPRVIGIYGTWGSGKSYLLDLIMRELELSAEHRHLTCVFQAWRYELEDNLAVGLASTLRDFADQIAKPGSERAERIREACRILGRTLIAVGKTFGGPVVGGVLGVGEAAAAALEDATAEPERPRIEKVQAEMRAVIEAIIAAARDDAEDDREPMVVIAIDDLDRCSPENMVRMFEWLKVHLTVPGCVYLLALDHVAAARAIVGRYREYLGETHDLAYGFRYLEKLVDLEVELSYSPACQRMALAQVLPDARGTLISGYVRAACDGDFPGLPMIDELFKMRTLGQPRTMLKVVSRLRMALDLINTPEGEPLRRRLPSSYPVWIALFAAMYFRLDPDEVTSFAYADGAIWRAMQGEGGAQGPAARQVGLDPYQEFKEFGGRWAERTGGTVARPRTEDMLDLLRLVRELDLPVVAGA